MPARIADNPKLSPRGTAIITTEVPPELRRDIVSIANRRKERFGVTVRKALEQYVAADRRRK